MSQRKNRTKTIHGERAPIKEGTNWSFSPSAGWAKSYRWVGRHKDVVSKAYKIKNEKTDEESGAPPAVNLTITPLGGGMSALDVSYDDGAASDNDSVAWDLQSADYEKDIWTHPLFQNLFATCPEDYKWLRENLPIIKEKGTFQAVEDAWDCSTTPANPYYVRFSNVLHFNAAVAPPTSTTHGAAFWEGVTGKTFTEGSTWTDNAAGASYVYVTNPATGALEWQQIVNACCAAAKILFGVFREGVEAYITSSYVLRQTKVLPTNTSSTYQITNTNKIHTWKQMEDLCDVPANLKFALPQDGEWLKKAPQVSYEKNKMTIETEWWHSDDWNNVIYSRAS